MGPANTKKKCLQHQSGKREHTVNNTKQGCKPVFAIMCSQNISSYRQATLVTTQMEIQNEIWKKK
jgi:hypothetical protein